MKIPTFRQFRQIAGSIEDVMSYLSTDLQYSMKELATALRRLTLDDNFDGWVQEVTIPAASEIKIFNRLETKIPSYRIILRGGTGSESVVDGDTEWTISNVYLKNPGGSPVTITVAFLA
jgi:hypothetical protein